MQIFDGKEHARFLEEHIKTYFEEHEGKASKLGKLAIVQIGDNAESAVYIRLKKKFCEKLKIPVEILSIPASLSDEEIISQVNDVLTSKDVAGGIIQLPLPRESLNPVLGVIPVEKDVDLLSPESTRRFYSGEFYRLPPTVRAFDYFITHYDLDLSRLSIGVLGYGDLVGKPIAHYSTLSGASVEIIGYYENQKELNYQLVVSSAGVPNLINPQNLEEGSYFIDFGSSRKSGKTVGDLDMSKDYTHLEVISPSPRGMGPLVVRFLIMNFLGI